MRPVAYPAVSRGGTASAGLAQNLVMLDVAIKVIHATLFAN